MQGVALERHQVTFSFVKFAVVGIYHGGIQSYMLWINIAFGRHQRQFMVTNMQESLGESDDARQRTDVAQEILKAATTQNLTC